MNPEVDTFLQDAEKWQEEFRKLRTILLGFPLKEEFKWSQPCYTIEGKNVVLIGGFKEYCALLFVKGALMTDAQGILVAPGKTQAGRQIRFSSVHEIVAKQSVVKGYVAEAIQVEKAGLKVALKAHSEYTIPEELQKKLDAMPSLKKAFEALTPGRQRGYMHYISAPKQSKTRESRAEKGVQGILEGRGLND
jgi:uncharacterized protein YdeI (YjbR/CyaY-like superfamily)